MRHKVYGRKLSRDMKHRKALRRNLIADLICHEQIITTDAKARMLRPAAEKMVTLAKRGLQKASQDSANLVHSRRLAASRLPKTRVIELNDGTHEEVNVVNKLFSNIAPRFADRNGGYTRMVKIGRRPGDNAEMAIVMFVDYGENDGADDAGE